MKILHNGQMIGGLGVYIQNSIIYNKVESNEYVIVCGWDDKLALIPNGIDVSALRNAVASLARNWG
jgi:hypothetical protein